MGYNSKECKPCKGTGIKFTKHGLMMIQSECEDCDGEGIVYKNPCLTCNGEASVVEKTKEQLSIPKGVENNTSFRIVKRVNLIIIFKGNAFSNRKDDIGDLLVKITIKRDNYFRRDAFDIHTVNYVSISEAVLGGRIYVRTLWGDVELKISPGTQDGEIKKILHYGVNKMPPHEDQKGHHLAKIKVRIPKKIDPEQRKIFEELQKYEKENNNTN